VESKKSHQVTSIKEEGLQDLTRTLELLATSQQQLKKSNMHVRYKHTYAYKELP
jgi:hypothetical protein